MRIRSIVIAVLVLAGIGFAESKYICKVSHLGSNDVAIVCTNGADPTGKKVGNVLLISCGQ